MFLIEKENELQAELLAKYIQQFQLQELPKLNKYWNYYRGQQKIQEKQAVDTYKPCNKITTNYCYNITNTYQGYLAGKAINYSGKRIDNIIDVLNYNDVRSEDSEFLRNALIYGVAYEINYIDMDGKQRFKLLDPRECFPIYSADLDAELLYVVRFFNIDNLQDSSNQKYYVEVYGLNDTKIYTCGSNFNSFSLLEERHNFFNQVPITVFNLNNEGVSIFDKVMDLQDAYNTVVSSEVDDWEAFCDSYMVLKGISADEEDIKTMKQNRVLLIDNDSSAEYLTKNVNPSQIDNMLKCINDNIHKIANAPDFNDEKLMAQSGIAMRYKLVGFENVAMSIEANMKKALQKRVELICSYNSLLGEEVWRDIDIVFTRNLPANLLEISQIVNNFRGLVSDNTLLAQIPFIDDVKEELKMLEEQKQANMELYSFQNEDINDE